MSSFTLPERRCVICDRTSREAKEPVLAFTQALKALCIEGCYAHASCIRKRRALASPPVTTTTEPTT